MTTIRIKTATMQNWVDRRKRKRKNFTADELWDKIKANWPSMNEAEHEAIFQGVKV